MSLDALWAISLVISMAVAVLIGFLLEWWLGDDE